MAAYLDIPAVAMLIEAISLAALLSRAPAPIATCHPGPVSYRFSGAPGTTFRYSGQTYSVPRSGSIELIGHGGESVYEFADRKLRLDVWPMNEFGTRMVPLPQPPPPTDSLPGAGR
jgi:hypothetical protein